MLVSETEGLLDFQASSYITGVIRRHRDELRIAPEHLPDRVRCIPSCTRAMGWMEHPAGAHSPLRSDTLIVTPWKDGGM